MPTALTLSGSIRRGSLNRQLQHHVGRRLEAEGVEVTAIELGNFDMPIFNEDLEPDNVPVAAERLAALWRSHDMIFIATPEYNGGLPPLLVNALAWISRQKPSPFRHAVIGIGGVSSGRYGTIWALSHLRDSLSKVGGLVVPGLLGIGPGEDAFDAQGDLVEPAAIRKVDALVHDLTHVKRG